jgi:SAM-dependent methyltransferase
MRVARLGIRTRLRATTGYVADLRHRPGLRRLGKGKPADYREYLEVQQRRTLSKRENDPGTGARELVRRIVELGDLSQTSSVLCVGCRNAVELHLFHAAGVGRVVGIDLVSPDPDILVMDMHDMSFDDAVFDAVYASHSLEHAYDVGRAVGEIARVGRPGAVVGVEVPLGEGSSDADRITFHGVGDLRAALEPVAADELFAEEQPARTATNDQGTPVARIVFRLSQGS